MAAHDSRVSVPYAIPIIKPDIPPRLAPGKPRDGVGHLGAVRRRLRCTGGAGGSLARATSSRTG